jgi:hypothetical protein
VKVRRWFRRAAPALAALCVGASPASAQGRSRTSPLALGAYVKPDGAITVFADGQYVEPYFAMRALNTAADLGADVDSLARGYIRWQLRRLETDTTFRRACLDGAEWKACGQADADDAALALWIELLYRTAGRGRMPAAWLRSAAASRRELAILRDPANGTYLVSRSVAVALFMDNVEVLSALETAGRTSAARATGGGRALTHAAARLKAAIDRVFWDRRTGRYRVSTQPPAAVLRFYPEIVGQIFPAVVGHGSPVASSQALVAQWLQLHERDWIAESAEGAAWGLVAAAAVRAGQMAAAACWVERAGALRRGAHWNVADEAVFLVLSGAKGLGDCGRS